MNERPLIERFLIPKPVFFSDLTGRTEEEVVHQSIDVAQLYFGDISDIFVKNPFGKFTAYSVDDYPQMIQDFVKTSFWRSSRYDASRSVGQINLSVFGNKRSIPFVNYGTFYKLDIEEHTGLGDGIASFNRKEGWGFTQRRGQYVAHAVFEMYSER